MKIRFKIINIGICAFLMLVVGYDVIERLRENQTRKISKTFNIPDLSGMWVIDDSGIEAIKELGYEICTNKYDHMIRLNNDGSCAYRGFDNGYIDKIFTTSPEQMELECYPLHFLAHGSNPSRNIFSFYILDRNTPKLTGPVYSTNELSWAEMKDLRPNKWGHWKVVKRFEEEVENNPDKDPVLPNNIFCPYHIYLAPHRDYAANNKAYKVIFHPQEDETGLTLFILGINRHGSPVKITFTRNSHKETNNTNTANPAESSDD